jgi:transcriptional regulator with XRE-family HTH domain
MAAAMDMRRLVGRNVRRIRLGKDLTQEQFAERSGFTQQYISGLERGRRNPTIVSIFELALALGVSHVDLVAPDDESHGEPLAPSRSRGRKTGGTN